MQSWQRKIITGTKTTTGVFYATKTVQSQKELCVMSA